MSHFGNDGCKVLGSFLSNYLPSHISRSTWQFFWPYLWRQKLPPSETFRMEILWEFLETSTIHGLSYISTAQVRVFVSNLYSIWTLKYVQCAQTSSPSYNVILYGTDFKAHILPVWWASGVKYFPVFNSGLCPLLNTGQYFTSLAHYTDTICRENVPS